MQLWGTRDPTSADYPGVDICVLDRDKTDTHSRENRGPSRGDSFHSSF